MSHQQHRLRLSLWVLLTIVLIVLPVVASAQEEVTVPDVTGLNMPQAAAVLNQAGLLRGEERHELWTEASGQPPNTVSQQAHPANTSVAPGTVVDLTVLHPPNMMLLYDDNDLTLVNQTGTIIDLTGLTFNALDGSAPASFAASRWDGVLRAGQCAQVWTIGRNGPKGLDDYCTIIQDWLWTGNTAEHFWNGAHGATQFNVTQNGIELGVCQVAIPGSCVFYLPVQSLTGELTPFVVFDYTSDQLIVHNLSTDQWMPLAGLRITNYAPTVVGSTFDFADPAVFGNPETTGQIDLLAPGQCLHFTTQASGSVDPPQECEVIAHLDLPSEVNFWIQAFEVYSVTDGELRVCPAALADTMTVCVLPR